MEASRSGVRESDVNAGERLQGWSGPEGVGLPLQRNGDTFPRNDDVSSTTVSPSSVFTCIEGAGIAETAGAFLTLRVREIVVLKEKQKVKNGEKPLRRQQSLQKVLVAAGGEMSPRRNG